MFDLPQEKLITNDHPTLTHLSLAKNNLIPNNLQKIFHKDLEIITSYSKTVGK
jgi:hypothetical protein